MKRFIISLVCIVLFINIVSTCDAKMVHKVSPKLDNNLDFYKLDSNEFMGSHKKCLIEFFNKRTRESKSGLVNSGKIEKVLVIPMEFKDVKFKRDNKEYEDILENFKKYYELNSCYEQD